MYEVDVHGQIDRVHLNWQPRCTRVGVHYQVDIVHMTGVHGQVHSWNMGGVDLENVMGDSTFKKLPT